MDKKVDVVILGGGLAGSLTAYKLLTAKPDLKIALLEASGKICGQHTWGFYESDLNADSMDWVKPLVSRTWDKTTVQFPRIEKTTEGRFHAVRSEDLAKILHDRLGDAIHLNAKVERATETHAVLENANSFSADLVLDARGLATIPQPRLNGYHKFVAYDLKLEEPHRLQVPVLMDASCPQLDGFRYYSILPWDENRVVVQENYFSDLPELNTERISRSIVAFGERKGWKITAREHEEQSCLPMPMTSEYLTPSNAGEALPIGTRGGYFHATTSNAFPDAVKIAEYLATLNDLTTPKVRESLMRFRRPWLSRQRFYRLLNRFLFFASEPSLRYLVLQHLYEQPSDVVSRYTGGRTSWGDRLRILSGRSPLPFDRALKSFSERTIAARAETRADS